MKFQTRTWSIALCLLAVTVVAIGLKARPAAAHAAGIHAAIAKAQVSRAMSVQPTAHLSSAELRAAVVRNVMMLDDDADPTRVSGNQQRNRTIFPPVEEFTLTPPNPAQGINKTTLSVRFPAARAEKLTSTIPITLANQNVVLQRSADDNSTFSTSLNFNWQRFLEEQAQRKMAASQGRMVPVFDGRKFVRTEPMQFIEPAQIEQALQSHQPIQFSGDVLLGATNVNVLPDHELMMTNLAVVEDTGTAQNPGRTFDQCLQQQNGAFPGNPTGAWTFNTLMLAIAGLTPTQNPQPAEQMLLDMLNSWNSPQFVNSGRIEVLARPNMGVLDTGNPNQNPPPSGLLGNWPVDPNTSCIGPNNACPSLSQAPVRLEAIVNRIDLGENGLPFPPAGELRFVFTVTTDAAFVAQNGPQLCLNGQGIFDVFNIILEYNVPSSAFPNAQPWATLWNNLQSTFTGDAFPESYLVALNNITNQVVLPNLCTDSNSQPISCIAQIRTNEIMLAPSSGTNADLWELREFHFSNSSGPVLSEATVAQSPDPKFNFNGSPACSTVNNNSSQTCNADAPSLSSYITNIALNTTFQETNGAAPPVPNNWIVNGSTGAFLGGSALNNVGFWNDNNIGNNPNDVSRIDFSSNTCTGCHGAETNTSFQQVVKRQITPANQHVQSNLASFLPGCTAGGTCTPGTSQQCPTSLLNMGQGTFNVCTESVPDPNNQNFPNVETAFGDLLRRVAYMQMVCGSNGCSGGSGDDLLLPFMNKPIGVH